MLSEEIFSHVDRHCPFNFRLFPLLLSTNLPSKHFFFWIGTLEAVTWKSYWALCALIFFLDAL